MLYEVWLQSNVIKELQKLKRRDRARWRRISERFRDLESDPKHGAIDLQDPMFKGLKRVRAGKDRIVFQICEDCRANLEIRELRNCIDCDNISEKGIKIFDVGTRDTIYSKHI